jgi:ubiquinone biosynthesis protein UbiJ
VEQNGETMALIWELVIAKAERLINKACAFDLNWEDYAKELDGKSICVQISQVDCTVYANINNNQISLSSDFTETPDLTVSGKPLALMQLATTGNPSSDVKIDGTAHLAQTIQKMMRSLDIDWEGFVALYTGDTIAHGLGKIKAQMEEIFQQSKNSLTENAGEYFLYETEMAAGKEEVEAFLRDVTDLEYASDRIEARINLLKDKATDDVQ